jgi:copper(I)-binding protein
VRRWLCALIATVIVLAAGPVVAQEAGLVLTDAYLQTVIPAVPAAGYFTLQNAGDTDRVLVGASSPGCGMLMLHQSRNNSGVEEMVAVDTITVQAHRNITFAPGGYHLMCMSPGDAVTPGGTVPVTLMFEDGGALTADFPVRSPTEN